MLAGYLASFVNGLATPLAAACVLPLYPGFISFLSGQDENVSVLELGVLVSAGVIGFMMAVGIVFSAFLGTALSQVIRTVSPAAFVLLAIGSLFLMAGREVGSFLPSVQHPQSSSPRLSSLAYGLFFGAIALPCSAGVVAPFLGRALLFSDPIESLLNFFLFGVGMAAPLLVLAAVSDAYSQRVIAFVKRYSSQINRISGAVMFTVSIYYLLVVFEVIGNGIR